MKGRKALKIEWDDQKAETRSSDQIYAAYSKLAATPGTPAKRKGDASKALDAAVKVIDVEYKFPYLAHARGATHLTVDASDTAEPFFKKRGFVAQRRQTVPCGDEWLGNTHMEKRFEVQAQQGAPK